MRGKVQGWAVVVALLVGCVRAPWVVEADEWLVALVDEADVIALVEILTIDSTATAADGPMYADARIVNVLKGRLRGSRLRFGASAWMGPTYREGELRVVFLDSVDKDQTYYHARWASLETGKAEVTFLTNAASECSDASLREALRAAVPRQDGLPPRVTCPIPEADTYADPPGS